MTAEAVAAVYAERVFDAVADRVTLAAFHVPFERLVPGSRVESHVADAIVNRGRVALVGRTGSGKSSLSAWVCSPARDLSLFPIPVRLADSPEVLADLRGFAQHLLRDVVSAADDAELAETRPALRKGHLGLSVGRRPDLRFSFGVPGLGAEISSAAEQAAQGLPPGGDRIRAAVIDVLAQIGAAGLQPVLIFDDTDRWIQTGIGDPTGNCEAFFGHVPRLLAELDVAGVVAVHISYQTIAAWRDNQAFFGEVVALPHLAERDGLARLLGGHLADLDLVVADVFDPTAITALYQGYVRNHGDIRRCLTTAHRAAAEATAAHADVVTARRVAAAEATFS